MIWLVLVLGGLVFVWWLLNGPGVNRKVSQMDLEIYLDILYRCGFPNSTAVITIPRRREFIQFRRRFLDDGTTDIQLGFPLASWSSGYYENFVKLVERGKIAYFTESTEEGTVTQFTLINFNGDLHRAGDLARRILREVFGVEEDVKVTVELSNCSLKEVHVESEPK
ncbi:MAG: hypothetical protein AAF604_09625 [Acidobacteriota bacterium]